MPAAWLIVPPIDLPWLVAGCRVRPSQAPLLASQSRDDDLAADPDE
jgi:hypothetical protein